MIPRITFTEVDPAVDVEALVTFLASNVFPFHRSPLMTLEQARQIVLSGRFWSADCVCFWVDAR